MSYRISPSKTDLQLLHSIAPVSRETLDRLQIYVDLLAEWQKKTNLVSNSTIPDTWRRHICDSVQFVSILSNKNQWTDIGTGAGFPGLVLAILGIGTEGFGVTLIESNQKKCAFLRMVIRETGAKAIVISDRIESVTKQPEPTQVVTARALTSLENLLTLTSPWLESGAIGLFSKGRDYLQEIEKCRGLWEFDLVKHKSRIEEDSVLLEIRNLQKPEA